MFRLLRHVAMDRCLGEIGTSRASRDRAATRWHGIWPPASQPDPCPEVSPSRPSGHSCGGPARSEDCCLRSRLLSHVFAASPRRRSAAYFALQAWVSGASIPAKGTSSPLVSRHVSPSLTWRSVPFDCAPEIGIDGAGWSLAQATWAQAPAGLLRPSPQHRSHVTHSQIHSGHCDKARRAACRKRASISSGSRVDRCRGVAIFRGSTRMARACLSFLSLSPITPG